MIDGINGYNEIIQNKSSTVLQVSPKTLKLTINPSCWQVQSVWPHGTYLLTTAQEVKGPAKQMKEQYGCKRARCRWMIYTLPALIFWGFLFIYVLTSYGSCLTLKASEKKRDCTWKTFNVKHLQRKCKVVLIGFTKGVRQFFQHMCWGNRHNFNS